MLRHFVPRNDSRGVIASAAKQSRMIEPTVVHASVTCYKHTKVMVSFEDQVRSQINFRQNSPLTIIFEIH